MDTFNVNQNGIVTSLNEGDLRGKLAEHYPAWSLTNIIDYLHDNEIATIDLADEANRYEVIDLDTARNKAGFGSYDADIYEGMGDSDDMIEAWVQDIESNLIGVVSAKINGMDSEFLITI